MTLQEYRELRSQRPALTIVPEPLDAKILGDFDCTGWSYLSLWGAPSRWIYKDCQGDEWVTKGDHVTRCLPHGLWRPWDDRQKEWAPFVAVRRAVEAELLERTLP